MDTPPFSELGLPGHLITAVESLGFERPSPIQAAAIPPALAGKDLVGLSETGSGKTAAFTLPALAKIDLDERTPQVRVAGLAATICEISGSPALARKPHELASPTQGSASPS